MLKHVSTKRLWIGAVVFCVLCVGGSLLYSWNVRRSTDAEFRRPASVQAIDRGAEDPGVSRPEDVGDTENDPATDDSRPMPEDTAEPSPSETPAETLESTELIETDDISADEPAEGVAVSPYGFGPYPKVPDDFPGTPIWERDSWQRSVGQGNYPGKNFELLSRVLVKLWVEQGVGSYLGGTISGQTGLVYPYFENTIYVKRTVHSNPDGTEGAAVVEVITPGNLMLTGEEIDRFQETGETPPGLRVLQIDTDGIEPYSFLNLQP